MTNIIQFAGKKQAEEESRKQACTWLVKVDSGLSQSELVDLKKWLNENKDNKEAFLEVATIWDQTSILAELAEIFPLSECRATPKYGFRRLSVQLLGLAIILIAGILASNVDFPSLYDRLAGATSINTYETAVGQQSALRLLDGSEVILNTNTLLQVTMGEAERLVILSRGEAHFVVAKDPDRPFRVVAGASVVEAVGTAFSVENLDNRNIAVTVTEGTVAFARKTNAAAGSNEPPASPSAEPEAVVETVTLTAGEYGRISDVGDEITKEKMRPIQLESSLAWRHGMLLFRGDSLESVVEEVSRYTTIRISMDDAIKDIEVDGYFRTGDIESLLLTMSETFDIKVSRLGSEAVYLEQNN